MVIGEERAGLRQYDYLQIDDFPDGERGTREHYRMLRASVKDERVLERFVSGFIEQENAVWEEVGRMSVHSE